MYKNKSSISISDEFSLTHDTGIKKPTLPWNRANAKQSAAMIAYQTLISNKKSLTNLGLKNPAASLFVDDNNNYAFSIYDRSERNNAKELAPEEVVLKIDPYFPK